MTKQKMAEVFESYYQRLINFPNRQAGGLVFVRQLGDADYASADVPMFEMLCHLAWMCRRATDVFLKSDHPDDFRKAATWLGYVQGELRAMKFFSIRDLRDHSRSAPATDAPPAYGTVARRFRFPIGPASGITRHPIKEEAAYFYGCYFPQTDLIVSEAGARGTGMPDATSNPGLEWLDPPVN